jgi:hypothetical protein
MKVVTTGIHSVEVNHYLLNGTFRVGEVCRYIQGGCYRNELVISINMIDGRVRINFPNHHATVGMRNCTPILPLAKEEPKCQ